MMDKDDFEASPCILERDTKNKTAVSLEKFLINKINKISLRSSV